MPLLLEVILYCIALVFCFVLAVFLAVHLFQEFTGRAPFIPISQKVLADIVAALELEDDSVMYDLGSGDGRVVFAVAQARPSVKAIGVERSFFPYILSHIEKRRKNLTNADFKRANFFDVQVGDATHIFLYLFPGLMNALLPKFEKELKPGSRVVSCDFKFKDKQPVKVIDLHRKNFDLGRKIYIYEF
jgi:ubiquinone/menaquinone biosynthesis C-methylase UbiE